MADKQSTIFYHEWFSLCEDLSDEEVGILTRAIFKYEINGENPTFTDRTMKAIWKTVKATLDRNKQKYEAVCEKRSAAGKRGGRPRKEEAEEKSKKQKVNLLFSEKAKKADSERECDSECERECDSECERECDSECERECDSECERGGGGDSECERVASPDLPPSADTTTTTLPDGLAEEIVAEWNAHEFTQKVVRITSPKKRFEKTLEACDIVGGPDQFLALVRSLGDHAYLRRQTEKGYKVIYDWFIEPENLQGVIEGRYKDDRNACPEGYEEVIL